ncbi:penicillin-binding protein activator [Thiorhodococcus minor]|uniref:ABC transporter substrate-binding protein n=1 Tax=Thiorhodococcus minor TaxID=57489 RepID=A0A6M0K105_9GAMM|nr:penicillin-binding protein activator [Thiorhodococcus minor]NEV61995.1 ABC transporter substrate-binding protein [Thiorhodococcus minor]
MFTPHRQTRHPAKRSITASRLITAPLLIAIGVSGCAVAPIQDESVILAPVSSAELSRARSLESQGKSGDAAKLYLSLASQAQPPAKAQLQIKAAQAYSASGRSAEAERTISAISRQSLTPGQQQLLLLTQAELALTADRPKDAIKSLERMRATSLPQDLKAKRLGMLASAQRLDNDAIAAAETLNALDGLQDDRKARLDNQVSLVSTLGLLSQSQLQTLARQGRGAMKGWAEVALLTQGSGADPGQLDSRYRQWKRSHSGHPALADLGRAYAETLSGGYAAGDRVTIMLPRSGRFAAAAKVVRDGIEAASRLDSGGNRPTLSFVDSTNAGRMRGLHASAAEKGASYAIGPLEKPAVDKLLATGSLPIPTLALNQATRDRRASNLYQFSLSPENEAAQAASKGAAMGAKRALILYPSGAWGDRLANAFRQQWRNLGGTIAGQATYNPAWSTYDKTLDKLFSGTDYDLTFFVATNAMARKIYPQVSKSAPHPAPVISTSHVYTGTVKPGDKVLEGLYFVDIPWILDTGSTGPLSRRAAKGAATSSPLARLYAMGIDAYRVAPRLTALASNPGAYYPGQTGGLAIDSLGHVTRQLKLGQFTAGGIRLVDPQSLSGQPR